MKVRCSSCKIEKEVSEFYKNKAREKKKDGTAIDSYCKACRTEQLEKRKEILRSRININYPNNKECRKCYKRKPSDSFHKNSVNLDGLSSYCKECNAKRMRTKDSLIKDLEAKDALMKLEWRPIPSTKGNYLASKCGKICSVERTVIRANGKPHTTRQRIIKTNPDTNGYLQFTPLVDKKRVRMAVHTAVYEAWVKTVPEGYDIDHLDSNILNNHVDNLEAVTRQEHHRRTQERIRQKYIREGYEQALKDLQSNQ